MPMAKQARQIWTEKLELVHPLPFSVVIFWEIGHLATIPIFWSNQCKKVQIIKHEWTPEIYKIKLHYIVFILYRMHTNNPKKTYPSQSSCNPLDAIIVSHVHKTTRHALPKFLAAKPTQQNASSSKASPTFGHANANLNDYHYSFL